MMTSVFDHKTEASVSSGSTITATVYGQTVIVTSSVKVKVIIRPVAAEWDDRLVVFIEGGDNFKYVGEESRDYEVAITNRDSSAADLYVTAY